MLKRALPILCLLAAATPGLAVEPPPSLKISPAGALLYSALFGGTGDDEVAAIDVDAAGNAYVTGNTSAADFPVLGGVQGGLGGGWDAFVLKVSPTGALVYSTYLGGTGFDIARDIAVEPSGGVAVTGRTQSQDFPRRNPLTGPCPALCGSTDAFVARLAPSGASPRMSQEPPRPASGPLSPG